MVSVIGKDATPAAGLKPRPLLEWVDDCSLILNEQGHKHHWQGEGPLSLKVVLKGEAIYKTQGTTLTIDENRLLVLNDHQDYTISIDNPFVTETFIVFFNRTLVDAVVSDFQNTSEFKLDNPFLKLDKPFQFSPDSKEFTSNVRTSIHTLRKTVIDNRQAEEQLYHLFQKLIELQSGEYERSNRLHFEKRSTRLETARRLLITRDFLHSNLSSSITLDDLAKCSALSKNQLLRTFKEYFGQTPFQYLADIRMQKARQLLTYTNIPITEVCSAVGLESITTFSWAFKKQLGLSPSQFQKGKKK